VEVWRYGGREVWRCGGRVGMEVWGRASMQAGRPEGAVAWKEIAALEV
jgi:hypothetical protein